MKTLWKRTAFAEFWAISPKLCLKQGAFPQNLHIRKLHCTRNEVFHEGTADLVTFTEEIFNGKLHFLCSVK